MIKVKAAGQILTFKSGTTCPVHLKRLVGRSRYAAEKKSEMITG